MHAGFFLLCIILWLIPSLWKKPVPHIFSLVASPQDVLLNESGAQPESPQRLSYDAFVQQHGAPPEPTLTEPPKKSVTVREIEAGKFVENLSKLLIDDPEHFPAESLSNAERQALSHYIAILKRTLNLAWDKPDGIGERQLETMVRFIVEPNGRIIAPSIVHPSGNQLFDNSVLQAFIRARNSGPTPGRTSYTLTLTFRMID